MFTSLEAVIACSKKSGKPFWQIVLEDDCGERRVTQEASLRQMQDTWEAMLSAGRSYEGHLKSASGLVGGDGALLEAYYRKNAEQSLCGGYVSDVITAAVEMAESNACMKRIVAAPTAGSCGVLPAVLIPCHVRRSIPVASMLEAMYTAAGVGRVIAYRASISGAEGGCQAEIGSASAMAAGALVHLLGGTAEQISTAAAMALQNLLGLVCDPVAGLVEIPCVKRNVIGAVNAVSCADMAMAGITCRIPADEVIDAMKEIGDKMDVTLRETGRGGLAATPFAQKIQIND